MTTPLKGLSKISDVKAINLNKVAGINFDGREGVCKFLSGSFCEISVEEFENLKKKAGNEHLNYFKENCFINKKEIESAKVQGNKCILQFETVTLVVQFEKVNETTKFFDWIAE
jgi:hypothetical protein